MDIEINGEPVDIQMKLDDAGAAFFVEDVSDSEDEQNLPPELATSPIPDQTHDLSAVSYSSKNKSLVNRSLIDEFNVAADEKKSSPNKKKLETVESSQEAAIGNSGGEAV